MVGVDRSLGERILGLPDAIISFKQMKFDFDSPNLIPGKSKLERCRGSIPALATTMVYLISPLRGEIKSNWRSLLTLPPPVGRSRRRLHLLGREPFSSGA